MKLKNKLIIFSQKILFLIFPQFNIDLNNFINKLNKIEYIVIKLETPYRPRDFPFRYAYGKDLDIIINPRNHITALNILKEFSNENKQFKKKIIITKGNIRLRFIIKNQLHYQIDISSEIENLGSNFLIDSIEKRIKRNNYYVPTKKYELIYRLNEYYMNNSKKHHLDYLLNNIDKLDINLIKSNELKELVMNLK